MYRRGLIYSAKDMLRFKYSELTLDEFEAHVKKRGETKVSYAKVPEIITISYGFFNVRPEVARSRIRMPKFVIARYAAMYFSWLLTGESLASIGRKVAKRNHSTVVYAVKTVKDILSGASKRHIDRAIITAVANALAKKYRIGDMEQFIELGERIKNVRTRRDLHGLLRIREGR